MILQTIAAGAKTRALVAQTYGTPFNYLVKVNDATIVKVASGERPYTGDNNRYGFYEPGTVVNVTAPETNNGKTLCQMGERQRRLDDPASISACAISHADYLATLGIAPRELQSHRLGCCAACPGLTMCEGSSRLDLQ